MNKNKIAVIIIFFSICFTQSQASLRVTFQPEIGLMGGFAEYEMDYRFEFLNYITGSPVLTEWRINSLLKFPLDTKIGGLSVNLFSDRDPSSWGVKLKYLRSLSDPNNKMKNSDWEGFSTLFPYTQFSYTESDAESELSIIKAEIRFRIMLKNSFNVSIFFSGRYQDINQDIIGYDGWYRPFDTIEVKYFDSTIVQSGAQDSLVLKYRLQVAQFEIGLQSDIHITDKFKTQIIAALAPVFLNDTDDHTLRKKISTSNSIGMGYTADLHIQYDLPYKYISFVQLNYSFNTFKAEGSQMQLWYEHKSGVDPNTQYGSIPHVIRSTQYIVSLQIGIKL